jgi:hypothetical protein
MNLFEQEGRAMRARFGSLGFCFLFGLAACKGTVTPGSVDGGPDYAAMCDNAQQAKSSSSCQLTLGQPLSNVAPTGGRYITTPSQADWYSFTTPSNADGRTLLHFNGGYSAAQTAVNFEASIVNSNAIEVLSSGADSHAQAPPSLVDLIVQFTQPSTQLFVRVQDAPANPQAPQIDLVHPYNLTVSALEDPDTNEPNNSPDSGTPVVLSASGGVQSGSAQGYISYPGDVDYFSINVPNPGQILYFHLGMTNVGGVTRPPYYQLAYTLYGPNGLAVSEGHVPYDILNPDGGPYGELATARLTVPGTYYLALQQWTDATITNLAGDLGYEYNLNVELLPNSLDPYEPNDSVATASPSPVMSPGSTYAFTGGRVSYVGDEDYYQVKVSAGTGQLLHYKLTKGGGASARFPALPSTNSTGHEVRAFTVESNYTTCVQDCPFTADPNNQAFTQSWMGAIGTLCAGSVTDAGTTPPMCLFADRTEADNFFPGWDNMEGEIPIPAYASSVILLVHANEDVWADDAPYTLQVDVWPDQVASPTSATLTSSGFDTPPYGLAPPPAGLQAFSGSVSAGYGILLDWYDNFNQAFSGLPLNGPLQGLRAPADFDRVLEADTFTLNTPAAAGGDVTWQLAWTFNSPDVNNPPFGLALNVQLCDTATPPNCTNKGTLQDIQSPISSWWNDPTPAVPYTDIKGTGTITVEANASPCICAPAGTGKILVTVIAGDKVAYGNGIGNYTVYAGLASYPQPSCPGPSTDGGVGGCQMTNGL